MIVGKLWDASTAAQQKESRSNSLKDGKKYCSQHKPDITVKTIKLLALLALENYFTKPKLRQIMKIKNSKKMQNTRKTKNTNIILEKHKSNYIKQDIARLTLQVFERASRWIGESKTFFYKPVFFWKRRILNRNQRICFTKITILNYFLLFTFHFTDFTTKKKSKHTNWSNFLQNFRSHTLNYWNKTFLVKTNSLNKITSTLTSSSRRSSQN